MLAKSLPKFRHGWMDIHWNANLLLEVLSHSTKFYASLLSNDVHCKLHWNEYQLICTEFWLVELLLNDSTLPKVDLVQLDLCNGIVEICFWLRCWAFQSSTWKFDSFSNWYHFQCIAMQHSDWRKSDSTLPDLFHSTMHNLFRLFS